MPSVVTLSSEQADAVNELYIGYKKVQTLGGYAGTGSLSCIKQLKRLLPRHAVCAYTGKATNVLRSKGLDASTIHSLIYKPEKIVEYTEEYGRRERVIFVLRTKYDIHCDGFIVDEASMVSREIHNDLLTFNLPIIYIGDHGQLEPISDDRSGNNKPFNIMESPDITLEKIHRNAGEIAYFAEFLRKGNEAREWMKHEMYSGNIVRFFTRDEWLDQEDPFDGFNVEHQIICAYNNTRVNLNQVIRNHLKLPPDEFVVGDRVICLQNSKEIGIFNGMQGIIENITQPISKVDGLGNKIIPDRILFKSDGVSRAVRIRPSAFNFIPDRSKPRPYDKYRIPFDYAYVITCHKSQGSEWDIVTVLEQRCRGWSHSRWAYTGGSRAKRLLNWVTGVT